VQSALAKLSSYINSGSKTDPGKTDPGNEHIQYIFIAFDEAHALLGVKKDNSGCSHFIELCWALCLLEKSPSFSFFLSTTSTISEFVIPQDANPSFKISAEGLTSSIPFSDLGFNHLMQDHKFFNKYKTINDVTSIDCIVHLGQPL